MKKIFIVLLLFISIVSVSCKRSYYYTHNDYPDKPELIKGKLFNLSCYVSDLGDSIVAPSLLGVEVIFKDTLNEKVIRDSSIILPIFPSDTLKLFNEIMDDYEFKYCAKNKWGKSLNIYIKYKVDSAGIILTRSNLYKNLILESRYSNAAMCF